MTIKLLAQTADIVTISRADLEALLRASEDAEDRASVEPHRAVVEELGWSAARERYLTGAEVRRLLAGDHPVRVWREKRGLSQRALAEKAGVSPGYLNEIEARKKPGSVAAPVGVARALRVAVDALVAGGWWVLPNCLESSGRRRREPCRPGTGPVQRFQETTHIGLLEMSLS